MTILSYVSILSIAAYVATFGMMRPIAGTLTFGVLVGFTVWALVYARRVTLSVQHLFVLVGLTTSVLGGFFGVALRLAIARGWAWLPLGFYEAHPATMDVGFVMPVAMGLAEWGLRRSDLSARASRAGLVQVGVMFGAFLVILVAALWEIEGLVGLGAVVAVIGLVIFFVRMWPLGWQNPVRTTRNRVPVR